MSKFDASVSVTTAKRRNKEAQEEARLAKTFTGWMNKELKSIGIHIENPFEEVRDGINLILLLESITKKNVEQYLNAKYIRNPTTVVQKVENVSLALKFLNDYMKLNQNLNPQDIVDGNKKNYYDITLAFDFFRYCYPSNQ